MATRIEDFFEQHIKRLPPAEQLHLVELIAGEIARSGQTGTLRPRSLIELHGLGAEIWGGMDAQQYVDELPGEWERRPLLPWQTLWRESAVLVWPTYAADRMSRNQNHIGILFDEADQAGARLKFVNKISRTMQFGENVIIIAIFWYAHRDKENMQMGGGPSGLSIPAIPIW